MPRRKRSGRPARAPASRPARTRAPRRPARAPARRRARAPAPRRRQADRREQTKTAIVRAALSLFQSKGFDDTSTKAIARKAGVAEGTVFNYFPTKEDIAVHFFHQELDHAIAAVRDNPRLARAPLEEKLFVLIQSQLEFLAPYERFIGSAVVHALRPTSKLGPFSTSTHILHLRYVEFVERLIEESIPKRRSPLARLWGPRAFWLFYLGILMYWLHDASANKEDTLALLDRSLQISVRLIFGGGRAS
jgi:AcrR family transcriptional regulator